MSRARESNHAARNHKGGHRNGNTWDITGDARDFDADLKKAQRTYAGGEDVIGTNADGTAMTAKPSQGYRSKDDGTPIPYEPGRVVYEAPTQAKEDFELRQKIRDTGILEPAGKAKASVLNYTVDQRDVDYIKERERQRLEKAYHEWCLQNWDPRTAEGKRVLKRQAPELLARMVETMKSEHELSMRLQEIDMLGIDENRPGDAQLLFLLDQQALVDMHKKSAQENYIRGFFMPQLKPVKAKHSNLWSKRGGDRLKRPDQYGPESTTPLQNALRYPKMFLTDWKNGWGGSTGDSNINHKY